MVLATHSHTLDTCTHTYVHVHGYTYIFRLYRVRVRARAGIRVRILPLSRSVALCGATLYRGWENGWRRHICGSVGSEGNHEWRERQPVDKRGNEARGKARRGMGGRGEEEGRKGVYADIRVSPVTAILRKTFDLFAHAVANPEERLIPTRMPGMPRLSPSPLRLSSFYTAPCIRPRPRTFRYPVDRAFLRSERLAKIQARRDLLRSGVPTSAGITTSRQATSFY